MFDLFPGDENSTLSATRHFTVVLFVFQFYPVYNYFLENFSLLDVALSRVKEQKKLSFFTAFISFLLEFQKLPQDC